ncbi:normocyte-binding protein 1 [Clonorchis sinensis]|uniref:Normocyte-binding protein 1 n=1 Tax=Clonorchis sinensis TaxID=79923 RepID=G7YVG4_CLOSI|nr:normocyte-binding protein 1 [Clonorchis sinensis]
MIVFTQAVLPRRPSSFSFGAVTRIRVKIPWPQPFEDGGVWTFLEDFEEVAEAAGLDTDRGKLAALKTLLKGRAKAALDVARRGPRKMDWAAAKEARAAEFDTTADRQEAMRRFKTARMAPGCDPTVFFAGLQQSLDRAFPGLDGASRHQLLSDQFVEGVQPALGAQLRLARATGQLSVEQLVHLARELAEAPLATFQSQENGQDSTVEDLKNKVDQLTEQLAAVKTESRRHARTSRCYKCGMPGHWRSQCPRTRPPVHNKILEYSCFPGTYNMSQNPWNAVVTIGKDSVVPVRICSGRRLDEYIHCVEEIDEKASDFVKRLRELKTTGETLTDLKPTNGIEAVIYFALCRNQDIYGYMIFQQKHEASSPYDLEPTTKAEPGRPYYIFGTHGVLCCDRESQRHIRLIDWYREAILCQRLKQHRVFRGASIWSAFARWRKGVRWCKFERNKAQLEDRSLLTNPRYVCLLDRLHRSSILESSLFSANSRASCTRCSTLNWPVALANRNWARSAGCTPTNLSDSNCCRDTPPSLGKARSSDCCRLAKNTVVSHPGSILAILKRLIASQRSAGVSNSAAGASFAAAQFIFQEPLLAAPMAAFIRPPQPTRSPPGRS